MVDADEGTGVGAASFAATITPLAVSTFWLTTSPKPVWSEFFSSLNLWASIEDIEKRTMNVHINTVTMSM